MPNGTDFSLVFPPDPVWVRSAREGVRTLLAASDTSSLAEIALLLTSEVVTNAVNACRRSGTQNRLTLFAECSMPGALRVLVTDDAPGMPEPRSRPAGDEEPRARAAAAQRLRDGVGGVRARVGAREGGVVRTGRGLGRVAKSPAWPYNTL
ncbi:ATP-binding protein [Streptomyces sp. SPB162]|uniref:ATP-binding protein n=1 Tax=Streptomyces sp. SPB162 TaxID=2940560 RepID=UPI0024057F75|nr:ATP-binding protein [Streptomyces sp. SPB162]MDF9814612.1 anti-sigma regulatory factor (Ser/Thr protein kinase) [Streptomyces sp. SPB162]